VQLVGDHQFDAAVIGELLQSGRRLRRGAKPRPAMDDHDPVGDFSQRQGPVDGRIAAARDDDPAAAEILASPDEVEDAALFERLDAGERRTVGPERADAGRSVIASPYIYSLSLAVYATAWTFYGSVGRAASGTSPANWIVSDHDASVTG